MFQAKDVEKKKLLSVIFSNVVLFKRWSGKILWRQTGHRWQYCACALHARYLRLQIHNQNM